MQYKIITGFDNQYDVKRKKVSFEQEVMKWVEDGWKLQGGVATYCFDGTTRLMQAIVKEE